MNRFLVALLLDLIMTVCVQAQTNYFPVGPWALAANRDTVYVKAHWDEERQKLMDLGVTYIEGWTMPHDTLWMKNVCEPIAWERVNIMLPRRWW